MDKKLLLSLIVGVLTALAIGLGSFWWLAEAPPAEPESSERPSRNRLKDTGTIDLFGLVMPGSRTAEGNTPIVRADLQIVVPLRHRIKVEKQTSKIRDIIAGILRNSDVPQINRDDLVGFKQQIAVEVRRQLNIEITEVLVLRFSYDIVSMNPRR